MTVLELHNHPLPELIEFNIVDPVLEMNNYSPPWSIFTTHQKPQPQQLLYRYVHMKYLHEFQSSLLPEYMLLPSRNRITYIYSELFFARRKFYSNNISPSTVRLWGKNTAACMLFRKTTYFTSCLCSIAVYYPLYHSIAFIHNNLVFLPALMFIPHTWLCNPLPWEATVPWFECILV